MLPRVVTGEKKKKTNEDTRGRVTSVVHDPSGLEPFEQACEQNKERREEEGPDSVNGLEHPCCMIDSLLQFLLFTL